MIRTLRSCVIFIIGQQVEPGTSSEEEEEEDAFSLGDINSNPEDELISASEKEVENEGKITRITNTIACIISYSRLSSN